MWLINKNVCIIIRIVMETTSDCSLEKDSYNSDWHHSDNKAWNIIYISISSTV